MGVIDYLAEQPYEERQRKFASRYPPLRQPRPLPLSYWAQREKGDTRRRSGLGDLRQPLAPFRGEMPFNENLGYQVMDAAKELHLPDEAARYLGDKTSEYIGWVPGIAAGVYGDWGQRALRKGNLGEGAWDLVQAKIGPDAVNVLKGAASLYHLGKHGAGAIMHMSPGLLKFMHEEGQALPYRAIMRIMDATSRGAMHAYPRIATNIGVFNDEMANRFPDYWPFTGTTKALAGEQEGEP